MNELNISDDKLEFFKNFQSQIDVYFSKDAIRMILSLSKIQNIDYKDLTKDIVMEWYKQPISSSFVNVYFLNKLKKMESDL